MKINIHAGHNPANKVACGAVGLLDESTENRNVVKELKYYLEKEGHTVFDCTCDNGISKSDVINKIAAKSNANEVDLDISIHFNSGANDKVGNGKSTGTECLIYNTSNNKEVIAKRICANIAQLGYKNRGVKIRTDLSILKKTKAPCILVECCFIDDLDDIKLYNPKSMAKAIAQGILNKTIEDKKENVFYRVVAGSYSNYANAEAQIRNLEARGIKNAFIDIYKK